MTVALQQSCLIWEELFKQNTLIFFSVLTEVCLMHLLKEYFISFFTHTKKDKNQKYCYLLFEIVHRINGQWKTSIVIYTVLFPIHPLKKPTKPKYACEQKACLVILDPEFICMNETKQTTHTMLTKKKVMTTSPLPKKIKNAESC